MSEQVYEPSEVSPQVWHEMVSMCSGKTLAQLSEESPVLLIFLRHFGCSFCREALSDISRVRKRLEKKGVQVVFVHMSPSRETAESFFRRYKLTPTEHISDPEKRYYAAFGLGRGRPDQLFGLMNWIRGFQAAVLEGHGAALHSDELGDGFQMPGVFLLYKGAVKHSFIHQHAWDRPNYEALVEECHFE